MTCDDRDAILARYLALEITAEHAADLLGRGTSVSEVILETAERFGRLPDRRDAFTEGEYRRSLAMLGLVPKGRGAEASADSAALQSSSTSRATTDAGSPRKRR